VSLRLLVQCDGTPADRPGMALERCRAFLPLTYSTGVRARLIANHDGWSHDGDRDLCPTCTRAITAAATS
jgi:hypothetical protein